MMENNRLSGSFVPQSPAAISSLPGVRNGATNLARGGRERAVSQAVSNFDLFQLDGNN